MSFDQSDTLIEPENRLGSASIREPLARMTALRRAAVMLGSQEALAGSMGIETRSLRAKLGGDRAITNADLLAASHALSERERLMGLLSDRLRELAV